ncbi:MAG: elongation factor P [bacterium]|nr:elongation factor P [bacterium]
MLEYNEIKEGKFIIHENEPYIVIGSHVFRKQQRKPVNATKLKNLISGRVAEYSFHQSEKAEEAEIDKTDVVFIYERNNEYWFNKADNKSERFTLPVEAIGEKAKFLKNNMEVVALVFNGKIIGIDLPVKVEYKVIEAAPGIKGDSSRGGTKIVTIEGGASVNVPLFINQDDVIRVNTTTGEYAERADKK